CSAVSWYLPSFPTRRSSDLFLDDLRTLVEQRRLPADLVGDGALDRTQRVDVLRLGSRAERRRPGRAEGDVRVAPQLAEFHTRLRSEEHTSELQSRENLVCRL